MSRERGTNGEGRVLDMVFTTKALPGWEQNGAIM